MTELGLLLVMTVILSSGLRLLGKLVGPVKRATAILYIVSVSS